jgi:hypothetical protein
MAVEGCCQNKIEYSARMTGSIFAAIDFPRFFGSLTREAVRPREV